MMQHDEANAVAVTRRYLSVLKKLVSEFMVKYLMTMATAAFVHFPKRH
jgi:hypothetical protein